MARLMEDLFVIKIRRYENGDTCPCCGQVIQNKTAAELERFSVLAAAVMMELDPGSLLTGYGEDPMEVKLSDLRDALADFLQEKEVGDGSD